MRTRNDLRSLGIFSLFAAFLLGGCTTNKITEPPRTVTEQLLLSTAADHALQTAKLPGIFANRKVFLDATYFDSYDSKYAIGTIRDALSRAGALLQDNATNSDIIIEARSGALSVDSSDRFFGIPKVPIPIPLAGTLETPEVAFYKSHTEKSVAKLALLAFAKASREHVYSSGPLDGKSYDKSHNLLFVSWIRTDIPEKQKKENQSEQYQTWVPQYDPANLTGTNAPGGKTLR
jgi:hypothetical protein